MSNVRLRRLQSDSDRLQGYISQHPRLQLIQAEGDPPEKYQIEYRIKSLRQRDGELQEVSSHLVEVALPRDYPRLPPQCRMLTPVFHPNIAPHAICIGDHWSPGESLQSIVSRIGEMLAYQSYNTKSPLNGEAARWCDQNIERLPLDAVSMAVEESGATGTPRPAPPAAPAVIRPSATSTIAAPAVAPVTTPAAAPAAAPPASVACPGCGARLRLTPQIAGRTICCPRCRTSLQAPALPA